MAQIKPIPKKRYFLTYSPSLKRQIVESEVIKSIQEIQPPEDIKSMKVIYNNFFRHNNCHNLLAMMNKYSAIDGVLVSGSSEIVYEYKNRYTSWSTYSSVLFEKRKFNNLTQSKRFFNCPAALLIIDYLEYVFVFNVDEKHNYQWQSITAPIEYKSESKIEKLVAFLEYKDAMIIIDKTNWQKLEYNEIRN